MNVVVGVVEAGNTSPRRSSLGCIAVAVDPEAEVIAILIRPEDSHPVTTEGDDRADIVGAHTGARMIGGPDQS